MNNGVIHAVLLKAILIHHTGESLGAKTDYHSSNLLPACGAWRKSKSVGIPTYKSVTFHPQMISCCQSR